MTLQGLYALIDFYPLLVGVTPRERLVMAAATENYDDSENYDPGTVVVEDMA